MTTKSSTNSSSDNQAIEHVDVLIIGAGISGLGAACHLQNDCDNKSYLVLEGRDAVGGTWDLFKYPGVRSDSDLYTFGYDFKPWHGQPIAAAAEILAYMHEVVDENNVAPNIRFNTWVTHADWSSEDARWTVTVKSEGTTKRYSGNFLFMCQGYYNYEAGYQPDFLGQEQFAGQIIHPQQWPEDLDYSNKKMVVIGSGATAATILPAAAKTAAHVTQLQRSPSYYLALDNSGEDEMIEELRALDVPLDWIHGIKRRKMLEFGRDMTERSMTTPDAVREELLEGARAALPEDYDVEKHFGPDYSPWKERLCLLPDGDMFAAIKSGKASVVTDQIDRFTKDGILLKSGDTLEADIIVTATGIELCGLGNIAYTVDGKAVDAADNFSYRGTLISNMPNLAWIFGYIRTSWTMRSDMIAHYVCRLLNHMDELGVQQCTPRLRAEDQGMNGKGYIDPEDFSPGYMQRGIHRLPKQSDSAPWINSQDYYTEKDELPNAAFDDGVLVFDNPKPGKSQAA